MTMTLFTKRIAVLLCGFLIHASFIPVTLHAAPRPRLQPQPFAYQQEEEKPDTGQIVIANFSQILMNFFGIISDPHNPQNLFQCGRNIVGNIANVAAEALKMIKLEPDELDNPELVAQKLYIKMLELKLDERCVAQAHRMKIFKGLLTK